MKTIKGYKIWQIVYPIGIYYVVSSLTFFALELFLGTEAETYMLRQMVCSAVTIPFIMSFYMQDQRIRDVVYADDAGKIGKTRVAGKAENTGKEGKAEGSGKAGAAGKAETTGKEGKAEESSKAGAAGKAVAGRQASVGKHIRNVMITVAAAAALGIAVNNILAMTPLLEASVGFQTANENFFGGQMIYELLGSCLLIPIAEELLYRGVVYRRLRMFCDVKVALLFSALIFGLVHANLVQFIYAAILGLLLAFLLEKTGCLYTAILGHMAANLVAVLRQEVGWLAFSYEPTLTGIGFTAVMLLIALIMIWLCGRIGRNEEHIAAP